jgi:hypothetical protein
MNELEPVGVTYPLLSMHLIGDQVRLDFGSRSYSHGRDLEEVAADLVARLRGYAWDLTSRREDIRAAVFGPVTADSMSCR